MASLSRLAAGASTTAIALMVPAAALAQEPTLKLVGADPLKVTAKTGENEAKATLLVLNERPARVTVAVSFTAATRTTLRASAPAVVARPGAISRVEVTFTGVEQLQEKTTGALVITGGSAVLARQVEVTPAIDPQRDWARDIVLLSIFMALGLAIVSVVWVVADANAGRLLAPAPGPKWSLDSWATTLTAAGAVLGTVLGSVTFPDVPEQITKDTLVTLNLFFGLLLVVGPFFFKALRRPKASPLEQEGGMYGTNVTLLLASCVLFAAVTGEIATLGLLFSEILDGGAETLAWIAAVVAELVATIYFLLTIPRVVATNWVALANAAKKAETKADRRRMKEFARILRGELKPDLGGLEDAGALEYIPDESGNLVGENAERPVVVDLPRWSLP